MVKELPHDPSSKDVSRQGKRSPSAKPIESVLPSVLPLPPLPDQRPPPPPTTQKPSEVRKLEQVPALLAHTDRPPFASKNRLLDPEALGEIERTLPGTQRVVMFADFNNLKIANDTLGPERVDIFIQQVGDASLQLSKELKTPAYFFRLGGDEIGCIAGNDHQAGITLLKLFFQEVERLRFRLLESVTPAPMASNDYGERIAAKRSMIKALRYEYEEHSHATGRQLSAHNFSEWLLEKAEIVFSQAQIDRLRAVGRETPHLILSVVASQFCKSAELLGTASVGVVAHQGPITFESLVRSFYSAEACAFQRKQYGTSGFNECDLIQSLSMDRKADEHLLKWKSERARYIDRRTRYETLRGVALLAGDPESAQRALQLFCQDPVLDGVVRYEIARDYGVTLENLGVRGSNPLTQIRVNIEGFGCFNSAGGYSCGDSILQAVANQIREELVGVGLQPALMVRKGGGELFAVCRTTSRYSQLTPTDTARISSGLQALVGIESIRYQVTEGHRAIAEICSNALDTSRIMPHLVEESSPAESQATPKVGAVSMSQAQTLILPVR